ncbi:MAG: hypothetical protein ACKVTZ_07205 [Bacteroidia bacterium]
MKRYIFLVGIFTALSINLLQAQRDTAKVYQISGMVVYQAQEDAAIKDKLKKTKDNEPIQYVSIRVNHSKQGVLTNGEGFYSIPVRETDTLYFSHAACEPTMVVIKEYLRSYKGEKSTYIYMVNYLREISYEIRIYPWRNEDEVKIAIVNMPIDHNTLEAKAKANLDPEILDRVIKSLPKDGEERYAVGRQMYYDNYKRQNLVPGAGLDVVAAAKLLQYIVQKTKEKRNKDLNYWEEE